MIIATAVRSSRLWPGMVFGLIGLNICIVGATIVAASARPSSFAVEPDYDRKALHWDDSARQIAHNRALGWSLRFDSVGSETIAVSVLDADGGPIAGADVIVEAFHHAHAGDRVAATLTPAISGGYVGAVRADVPGLWEFRFTVLRGPETFTSTITRIVIGAGS